MYIQIRSTYFKTDTFNAIANQLVTLILIWLSKNPKYYINSSISIFGDRSWSYNWETFLETSYLLFNSLVSCATSSLCLISRNAHSDRSVSIIYCGFEYLVDEIGIKLSNWIEINQSKIEKISFVDEDTKKIVMFLLIIEIYKHRQLVQTVATVSERGKCGEVWLFDFPKSPPFRPCYRCLCRCLCP